MKKYFLILAALVAVFFLLRKKPAQAAAAASTTAASEPTATPQVLTGVERIEMSTATGTVKIDKAAPVWVLTTQQQAHIGMYQGIFYLAKIKGVQNLDAGQQNLFYLGRQQLFNDGIPAQLIDSIAPNV